MYFQFVTIIKAAQFYKTGFENFPTNQISLILSATKQLSVLFVVKYVSVYHKKISIFCTCDWPLFTSKQLDSRNTHNLNNINHQTTWISYTGQANVKYQQLFPLQNTLAGVMLVRITVSQYFLFSIVCWVLWWIIYCPMGTIRMLTIPLHHGYGMYIRYVVPN